MTKKNFELSKLRMDSPDEATSSYRHKRSLAVALIVFVVVAIVSLLVYVGRDAFLPATEVRVVQAMAIKSIGTGIPEGEFVFQSAGWVEPAPFPINAMALVSGTVKTVHVIEGARVRKGGLIAELIDDDLKLDLKEIVAERKQAEQVIKEIDAEYHSAMAATKHHNARIVTENSRLKKLVLICEITEKGGDAVPKIDLINARQNVAIQRAMVDEIKSEALVLAATEGTVQARKIAKQAVLGLIEARQDRVELALKRTKIYAPTDGIILRLFARNGSRINLDSNSTAATTVAEMYEPSVLQVRVDVPLADAGGLSVGQKALIRAEILPDREFKGAVTSIVGRADITRNTLQAKVKIIDPDSKLRPEMLAKVRFLATNSAAKETNGTGKERIRVFIPEESLDSENRVWVVDRISNRIALKKVTLGHEKRDGWIEVISGVNAGQQVVVDDTSGLRPNMRIRTILRNGE